MYSLRARYYDPATGRFLTRDTWPLDTFNPVELNRYQYGMSNPVTFSDPSGHFALLSYGNFSLKSMALSAVVNGIFSGIFSYTIQRIFLPEEDFSGEQVWKDALEGALFGLIGAGIGGYFTHMLKGWKALAAAWAAETAVETVYDTFTSDKSFLEALLWNSVTNLAADAAGGAIEGGFKWWKNNYSPEDFIDLVKRTSHHSAKDATDTAVTTARRSSETPGGNVKFGGGGGREHNDDGDGEDNTNRRRRDDKKCDYRVQRHGDMPVPRPTNYESHHGVPTVWMDLVFGDDYNEDDAPAILMPKNPDHNATRSLQSTWGAEMRRKYGTSGRAVPWEHITRDDVMDLAHRMLGVTRTPIDKIEEYWRQFDQYEHTLITK